MSGPMSTPHSVSTAIAHHQRHPLRQVLDGTHQRQPPAADVALSELVADIDHPEFRGDAGDHTMDDPDELVVAPEVR